MVIEQSRVQVQHGRDLHAGIELGEQRDAAATVHERFTDGMIFASSLAEMIGHELPYEYARDYPFMASAEARGEYEKQRRPKSKAVTPRQGACPVAVYRNVNRPARLASPEVL